MADLPIPPLPSSAPPAMERVNLRGKVINPSALHRIPQTTAERYQVVCFEETPTSLKLAIVYPEQLKQGFFTAIKDLGAKLGRSIELFQTDAASLRIAIGQYVAAPAVVVPDPDIHLTTSIHPPYPKPPLFELGASVAFSYLRRVPIDFARTHRVMCVDFVSPNTFWFVIDRKAGDAAIRILQQIEERNHMQIVPLPIATLEFDDLLGYYEAREKERQDAILKQVTEGKEQKKVEAPDGDGRVTVGPQHISGGSEGENELSGEEQVLAADVLEPAAQAAILTSEEERGGIAGLFQKMNQTSVAGKAAPVATLEAAKVEIAATENRPKKMLMLKLLKQGVLLLRQRRPKLRPLLPLRRLILLSLARWQLPKLPSLLALLSQKKMPMVILLKSCPSP